MIIVNNNYAAKLFEVRSSKHNTIELYIYIYIYIKYIYNTKCRVMATVTIYTG